jgi:crossover junction endodeoxyribonuclease RusA
MINLYLPWPPSVNALYSGMRRRYKSARYQKWEIEAANSLRMQKWSPLAALPLQIKYVFGRPDKRRRDLANYLKPIDDLLVHQNVIIDDSWIHRGIFEWGSVEGIHLEITTLR